MSKKPKANPKKGNKAGDGEITGAQAQRLKQKLEAKAKLDEATLLKLLKSDKPCEGLYSKACKGKSNNSNCLCNIIPAPDAHRKTGLWSKTSTAIYNLGPDPTDSQRTDPNRPVGLRNLGNTCYVNSVLQCLYAIEPFRTAVFALTPPVADAPVISELRDLFVQMKHGKTDPLDPAPLAKALQLDHAVQQDGQEFMKLFLTHLEHRFDSGQPELRGFIQHLFRGQMAYETICQTCKEPSESSKRSDPFYELDIPVRGFKSMQESLQSLLSKELLCGDNQYSCDTCNTKTDATRQLRVRELPPLFCISLQRFIFDYQKLDRVKVNDKFAFPLELDASIFRDNDDAEEAQPAKKQKGKAPSKDQREPEIYDLQAILVHKGGSAMHGHYVAHIKLDQPPDGVTLLKQKPTEAKEEADNKEEEVEVVEIEDDEDESPAENDVPGVYTGKTSGGKTKKKAAGGRKKKEPSTNNRKKKKEEEEEDVSIGGWWRFDDDQVTKMAKGPLSSPGDHGIAAASLAENATGKGGKAKGGAGGKKKGGKKAKKNDTDDDETGGDNDDDPDFEVVGKKGANNKAGGGKKRKGATADKAETSNEKKPRRAAAGGAGKNKKGGKDAAEVDEEMQQVDLTKDSENENGASGSKSTTTEGGEIVSANAYLLVYKRRGAQLKSVGLGENELKWINEAPARLEEEFEKQRAVYAATKQDFELRRNERRKEVRSLVEASAVPKGDVGRYISSEWLSTFADGDIVVPESQDKETEAADGGDTNKNAKPEADTDGAAGGSKANKKRAAIDSTDVRKEGICPIDNSVLVCPHGHLDPAKVPTLSKRISSHVWEELKSRYQGGPELSPNDACTTCLQQMLDGIVAKEDTQDSRDKYLALATHILDKAAAAATAAAKSSDDEIEDAEEEEDTQPTGRQFYVSKLWLGAWKARAGRSMSTTSPTAAITCPHGGLAPENLTKMAKRIAIPHDFWEFLERSWQASETERLTKQRLKNQKAGADKNTANAAGQWEDESVIVLDGADGDDKDTEKKENVANGNKTTDADGADVKNEKHGTADKDAAANSTDIQPLLAFEVDRTQECSVCRLELHQAATLAKGLQGRRQEERAILSPLAGGIQTLQLIPGQQYKLVPTVFMDHWRSYMNQGGRTGRKAGGKKTGTEVIKPPNLTACMTGIACSCHRPPQLSFPPPHVVNKRGRWMVVDDPHAGINTLGARNDAGGTGSTIGLEESVYEVVTVEDWASLCMFYGEGGEESEVLRESREWNDGDEDELGPKSLALNGITVTLRVEDEEPKDQVDDVVKSKPAGKRAARSTKKIDCTDDSGEDKKPACATRSKRKQSTDNSEEYVEEEAKSEIVIEEDDAYQLYLPKNKSRHSSASGRGWLEPEPTVCAETVAQREATKKVARLCFVNEDVMVEVVPTDEEAIAGSLPAVGGAATAAGDVAGERKSKRARKGRAPISCDGSTTIRLLRLKIFENLGVHPRNIRMFMRGSLLDAHEDMTLAQCEVFPGEELKVVDTHEHDVDDIASLFGPTTAGGPNSKRPREAERGFAGTALVAGGLVTAAPAAATNSGAALVTTTTEDNVEVGGNKADNEKDGGKKAAAAVPEEERKEGSVLEATADDRKEDEKEVEIDEELMAAVSPTTYHAILQAQFGDEDD